MSERVDDDFAGAKFPSDRPASYSAMPELSCLVGYLLGGQIHTEGRSQTFGYSCKYLDHSAHTGGELSNMLCSNLIRSMDVFSLGNHSRACVVDMVSCWLCVFYLCLIVFLSKRRFRPLVVLLFCKDIQFPPYVVSSN